MADDQREVIAFLARPESHGRGDTGRVERIETHASIVFLTDESAVKLKKSVRFAYLDYSTPELRRHSCEAELRLNRRTAPQLYKCVRAINRAPDGRLSFDGEGNAVDWVVEMRRFDQANLFSALADAGRLTHELLAKLVDEIVAFHSAAERTPQFGGRAAMAEIIAINDHSLRAAGLPRDVCDRLSSESQAALDRIGPLLDARRAGKVRRCHGDLHLGNVCLLDGRPTLFDAIEFSDAIAGIDILYDVAFLLMDLCRRDMADAASLVFNRYLDLGQEDEGIAALPLFLSLRAAVRAHVVALAGTPESMATARAYLDFALAALAPGAPRLVAIGGLSGTGKSTLAAALAPRLGAPPGARVLRSDVLRKQRAGTAMNTRLPARAYTQEASVALYREMQRLARQILSFGYSVVIDAVSARLEERAAFAAAARSLGASFHGFWLEAPAETMAGRLTRRRGDASDAGPEIMRQQLGYEVGSMEWTRIDAAGSPEATLQQVRQALFPAR